MMVEDKQVRLSLEDGKAEEEQDVLTTARGVAAIAGAVQRMMLICTV